MLPPSLSTLLLSEVLNDVDRLCSELLLQQTNQRVQCTFVPLVNLLHQTAINGQIAFLSVKGFFSFLIAQQRPSHFCTCHYPPHRKYTSELYLFIMMWKNTVWVKDYTVVHHHNWGHSHVCAWCRKYESFVNVFTQNSEMASWKTNSASAYCF